VRAHADTATWNDIGELRSYARANWAWLGLRGLKSWVAPDAYVSPGATLTNAVIGAGACIDAPRQFENVIVWPGARVDRSVRDGVVMDSGDIVALPTNA
jgi:NDP-sugar pyrophosphorylase family protein